MYYTDAIKVFRNRYPDLNIKQIVEYKDFFVIEAQSTKFKAAGGKDSLLNTQFDSTYKVDKETDRITTFYPMDLSSEEYNSGKVHKVTQRNETE